MNSKKITHFCLTFALMVSLPAGITAQVPFSPLTRQTATGFSTFSPPQNMGSNINSADMEQAPAPSPNGLSLYFTSSRTAGGQGGNDIWVTQRGISGGPWGPAQNLGTTLNTSSNDTVTNISRDGLKMFITSNRAGGSGGPDLYISTRTDPNNDFGWSAPANLGPIINSSGQDVGGVYVNDLPKGQAWLYFWSDRAETGLGNLYKAADNLDGTFLPPVLVNELNSTASERGIAISPDGLEAFISSNRLGPPTVFAIFVSTRATTLSPWNTPVPLAGLNSGSTSQPALSYDGTLLYMSSNRTGTIGSGDIYSAVRVSVNRTSTGDFDGDGRTDLTLFRPSNGTWYSLGSTNVFRTVQWGLTGDVPIAGDFDGDGRNDHTVYRGGEWHIMRSADGGYSLLRWGLPGDVPTPGDYDGDGRTDLAVYRNDTWYIIQSSTGYFDIRQFGLSGDIPIAAP